MILSFRKLLGLKEAAALPSLPAGERAYAIGDVHGRLDLLTALIRAIETEDAALNARTPANTTMILLGDLIDRGPDSAGVIALAQAWQARRRVRILLGNHEEMLLGALTSTEVLRHLLRHGGRETALSFGIPAEVYAEATYEEVQQMLLQAIPPATLDFIRSFEDQIRLGDYVFVHAGVRPGVALDEQKTEDLRWIREPFLSSPDSHGAVIVHGHTIADEPALRHNRIGIDTGAYNSNRLTALGLQGAERWLIVAQVVDGTICVNRQTAA